MSKSCMHTGPHTSQCSEPEYLETGDWFGYQRIPLYRLPLWPWPTTPVACEHCFCQKAPYVEGVPHNKCCHCGQTHAQP